MQVLTTISGSVHVVDQGVDIHELITILGQHGRVVLKPGTERNGTERMERTGQSFFVGETKVGPISVYMLHCRGGTVMYM